MAPAPVPPTPPPPSNQTPDAPTPPENPQPITHVAESTFEFLLGEILHWVESECDRVAKEKNSSSQSVAPNNNANNTNANNNTTSNPTIADDDASRTSRVVTDWKGDGSVAGSQRGGGGGVSRGGESTSREEAAILAAERAAAKIERLGFGVGYRLCERLAQGKPLAIGGSTGGEGMSGGHLEAVKFLCKEFWTEVFRKQIDKLQTNHRGVFVLKDHELRWLRRLPSDDERARVAAIKMLAFPCGLIRGALSNLGIAAVVSCDFLADGKNMAACSFNIKIKT